MKTERAARNDNAAGGARAPVRIANDNAFGLFALARPVRPTARRAAALAARAVSDATPPLALAIYVSLAALTIGAFLFAGCGPELPPPSLIESTRVVGARVEVEGAPERASPAPGERATVTWLVTAPGATPPLGWAFALCAPDAPGKLDCASAPFGVFEGNGTPRLALEIPNPEVLAGAGKLMLYGRICTDAAPTLDPATGRSACAGGGEGTTVALAIALADTAADPGQSNHNPAEGRFTFDGADWAPAPGLEDDPCAAGLHVSPGSGDHTIATVAMGGDRETFTHLVGDPPAPTVARESLQISYFSTAGALDVPFGFIEGDDAGEETPVTVAWTAPKAGTVAEATPVTFTFVTRDSRGGTAWTSRTLCLSP